MKTLKTLLLLGCLYGLTCTQAQTDPKTKTEVNNNFLDLQASTYGKIFGDSLTGGKGKVNNYLDLVNKSNMPESDKQKLRDTYAQYSAALDAQGKDSLQTVLSKQLLTVKKDTIK